MFMGQYHLDVFSSLLSGHWKLSSSPGALAGQNARRILPRARLNGNFAPRSSKDHIIH
jgi:hypothetical protein